MDISGMTITNIRTLIDKTPIEELNTLGLSLKNDPRKGVQNLHKSISRKIKEDKARKEKKKLLLRQEYKLWNSGYELIGGMDEAGRGPLAGPVVAACVVFKPGIYIDGVDDSKKLSPKVREKLYDIIMDRAQVVGIGRVDSREIDRINILNATKLAMRTAAAKCYPHMDFLLVDALEERFQVPYRSITKGDLYSHSIAAASIVAKVERDREMLELNEIYPGYGFDRHKGYGTQEHIQSIERLGLSPIHRRTFTYRITIKGQGYGHI